MSLFGPPNIDKLTAKDATKGLVKALGYKKDKEVRAAAAAALGGIGDAQAVQPLIAALKDENESVCTAAIQALGRIRDVQAVEPLIAALEDTVTDARQIVKSTLFATQSEVTGDIREAAVRALGQIGDPRAIQPLIAVIKTVAGIPDAFPRLMSELGVPFKEADMSKKPYSLVEEASRKHVQAVIGALQKIGAPSVEPLRNALEDQSATVREAAATVLDHLNWQPDQTESGAIYWVAQRNWSRCVQLGVFAIRPLMIALRDNDPEIRRAAVTTLGKIEDAHAVELIIDALSDKSNEVREAAIKELSGLGAVAELVIAILEKKKKEAAIESLSRIGARAVEPLISILTQKGEEASKVMEIYAKKACKSTEIYARSNDESYKKLANAQREREDIAHGQNLASKNAAQALGQIGDARAVKPLIATLTNKDEMIFGLRQAAAQALGEIGDLRAIEPLIATLTNKGVLSGMTWEVRENAANALDRLGWRPNESTAGASYWVAKREWDKCVSMGALAIEPLFAAHDSYRKSREKDDWRVGRDVAKTLKRIRETMANNMLEGLLMYRVVRDAYGDGGYEDWTELVPIEKLYTDDLDPDGRKIILSVGSIKPNTAVWQCQKELESYEAEANKLGLATGCANLGILYDIRGELDKTENMCKRAINLFQEIGEQPQIVNQLQSLLEEVKK